MCVRVIDGLSCSCGVIVVVLYSVRLFRYREDDPSTELKPLTTYGFRIRAFNAFGASAYTSRHFTTGPSHADVHAPVVARCSADSVTLRWDPRSAIGAKIATLQTLFDAIDTDGSG